MGISEKGLRKGDEELHRAFRLFILFRPLQALRLTDEDDRQDI